MFVLPLTLLEVSNSTDSVEKSIFDVIPRVLESNGFAFLLGILVGFFIIIKWLDIPDKLNVLNDKFNKLYNRQKTLFNILNVIYEQTNKKPFPVDEPDSEIS